MRASSKKLQGRWIPKDFRIDKEFGCLTHAEKLCQNKKLTFTVGRTRLGKKDKWGEHAWCITKRGSIIDPYFQWRFPNEWHLIEYKKDPRVFGGDYT